MGIGERLETFDVLPKHPIDDRWSARELGRFARSPRRGKSVR